MKKDYISLQRLMVIVFLFSAMILLFSCTDNIRARNYGGTEEIILEPHEKFINITWKEADLWVIVQDTITGDYYAREKSSFGIWEGRIIVHPNQPTQIVIDTTKSNADLSGWKPPIK